MIKYILLRVSPIQFTLSLKGSNNALNLQQYKIIVEYTQSLKGLNNNNRGQGPRLKK
jgi:hypothetical protein